MPSCHMLYDDRVSYTIYTYTKKPSCHMLYDDRVSYTIYTYTKKPSCHMFYDDCIIYYFTLGFVATWFMVYNDRVI